MELVRETISYNKEKDILPAQTESIAERLRGSIPDSGYSVERLREERLKKYEITD